MREAACLPLGVRLPLLAGSAGFLPCFDFGMAFDAAFPFEGKRPAGCFKRSFTASRLAGLGVILLTFFVVFADMDVTRTQPLRVVTRTEGVPIDSGFKSPGSEPTR
jgi:hypothetical protein